MGNFSANRHIHGVYFLEICDNSRSSKIYWKHQWNLENVYLPKFGYMRYERPLYHVVSHLKATKPPPSTHKTVYGQNYLAGLAGIFH